MNSKLSTGVTPSWLSPCAADLPDRRENVRVRPATADIAAHQLLHVRVARAARLVQQRHRGHDLPRGAVPALVPVALDERGLHRVQVLGGAQPFDGGDLVALVHEGKAQAGVDPPAVDVNGAGAALAVIAA